MLSSKCQVNVNYPSTFRRGNYPKIIQKHSAETATPETPDAKSTVANPLRIRCEGGKERKVRKGLKNRWFLLRNRCELTRKAESFAHESGVGGGAQRRVFGAAPRWRGAISARGSRCRDEGVAVPHGRLRRRLRAAGGRASRNWVKGRYSSLPFTPPFAGALPRAAGAAAKARAPPPACGGLAARGFRSGSRVPVGVRVEHSSLRPSSTEPPQAA